IGLGDLLQGLPEAPCFKHLDARGMLAQVFPEGVPEGSVVIDDQGPEHVASHLRLVVSEQ
ncbi:MAG: hypothetical protein OEU55_15515, partial [Desulfobacterales bacterium]|nr:hypothetical protein [Desulfobacterales bacterium]